MIETLVTEFKGLSSDNDAIKIIELDDIRNLDSSGAVKNTFYPGDNIYFYVHLSPTIKIKEIVTTDGKVVFNNIGERTRKETNFFTSRDIADLSVYTTSVCPLYVDKAFYGRRSGSPKLTINENGSWAYTSNDIEKVPYMVDFVSHFNCYLYTFVPPATLVLGENESYSIGIVIYLEEIK